MGFKVAWLAYYTSVALTCMTLATFLVAFGLEEVGELDVAELIYRVYVALACLTLAAFMVTYWLVRKEYKRLTECG